MNLAVVGTSWWFAHGDGPVGADKGLVYESRDTELVNKLLVNLMCSKQSVVTAVMSDLFLLLWKYESVQPRMSVL